MKIVKEINIYNKNRFKYIHKVNKIYLKINTNNGEINYR